MAEKYARANRLPFSGFQSARDLELRRAAALYFKYPNINLPFTFAYADQC